MPYLKPEQLYRLQMLAVTAENNIAETHFEHDALQSAMSVCPICGEDGCSKTIVEANNVWVHPEDVDDAEQRDNPKLKGGL